MIGCLSSPDYVSRFSAMAEECYVYIWWMINSAFHSDGAIPSIAVKRDHPPQLAIGAFLATLGLR